MIKESKRTRNLWGLLILAAIGIVVGGAYAGVQNARGSFRVDPIASRAPSKSPVGSPQTPGPSYTPSTSHPSARPSTSRPSIRPVTLVPSKKPSARPTRVGEALYVYLASNTTQFNGGFDVTTVKIMCAARMSALNLPCSAAEVLVARPEHFSLPPYVAVALADLPGLLDSPGTLVVKSRTGSVLADTYTQFIQGSLRTKLNDADSEVVAARWWTGSGYPATSVASEVCDGGTPWTANTNAYTGRVGLTYTNDSQFISKNNVACDVAFMHVLCLCA